MDTHQNSRCGSNIPSDVATDLANLIAKLAERYEFKNGSTAAYWHLVATLQQHLGNELQ